jgi:hypothetical protein
MVKIKIRSIIYYNGKKAHIPEFLVNLYLSNTEHMIRVEKMSSALYILKSR